MPTRDITEETGQIAAGQGLASEPVRDALNEIVSWFATTSGLGISNSDIATDAAIVSSKLKHQSIALNTFMDALGEHNSTDGTHTIVSQGAQGLVVAPGAGDAQVAITADFLTLENSAGSKALVGLDVNGDAETISETITLGTAADGFTSSGTAITPAAATTYTIICLQDRTTGGVFTTKFVFYTGTAIDSTFFSTDLAGYNTRVSQSYTHAKIVGAVYNNTATNAQLEQPRPIAAGSIDNRWLPGPVMMAIGSFTGTGADEQITGLDFTPVFVIVANTADTHAAFFRQTTQGGSTASQSFGGAAVDQTITSIDYDGFSVGTSIETNKSGDLIFWIAFRADR